MNNDPRFPALVKLLCDRGWTEADRALNGPRGTIWIELDVNWPASITEYREIIFRRWERISNVAAIDDHEIDLQNSISDTSDLLECLSRATGESGEQSGDD